MNLSKSNISVLILSVICLAATSAAAQLKITRGTFGSGGNTAGTLAQPVIGITKSAQQINKIGFWYRPVEVVTGVEKARMELPSTFSLAQNYPNPFNPHTTIGYAVPQSGLVTLRVYNIVGQEVATLVNESREPGFYQVTFDGQNLTSGIYFYRMQSGSFSAVRRFMLLK